MPMKNNLRLLTDRAPRPALSPARQKLQDLLDQVTHHEKRIAEHQAAADRLTGVIEANATARAALDDFDRQSAAAVAEWAKASLKPRGTAPIVDGKRRLELLSDLGAAQENASAAFVARQQFTAAIQDEARAITALKTDIARTIAEIIAELASGPMMEDLQDAQRALAVKQSRLQQALQTIVDIAHSGGPFEAMRPTFILMESLAETFRTTAPQAVDTGFADRQMWEAFRNALRSNAAAELEG
jgi:hypothetical protein